MIAKSVETSIKKVRVKGLLQKIFGWSIAVLNGFFALVGGTASGFKETIDVVMVSLLLCIAVLGVFLIISGNEKAKIIERFRDYSSRLETDPEKSIDLLVSAAGVTVIKATKSIRKMMAYGFFPGYYLDDKHNKLVRFVEFQPHTFVAQTANHIKYITVQCKGCGATNKIISGAVGECEFCG